MQKELTTKLHEAENNVDDINEDLELQSNNIMAKPLSGLCRVLSESDLESSGVRKMLLGQMDEFESCKNKLEKIEANYHQKDKESAVLSETLKNYKSFDLTYSGLLTVGSILIGFYASQPDKGRLLLVIGVVSVFLALFIKYKRSK